MTSVVFVGFRSCLFGVLYGRLRTYINLVVQECVRTRLQISMIHWQCLSCSWTVNRSSQYVPHSQTDQYRRTITNNHLKNETDRWIASRTRLTCHPSSASFRNRIVALTYGSNSDRSATGRIWNDPSNPSTVIESKQGNGLCVARLGRDLSRNYPSIHQTYCESLL